MLGNNASTPFTLHDSQISSPKPQLTASLGTCLHHSSLHLVLGYRKDPHEGVWSLGYSLKGRGGADTSKPDALKQMRGWGRHRQCLGEDSPCPYPKHLSQMVGF